MSNPCPNCGTNVVTGAVACPVCGVALQSIGVAGQSNAAWPPIAPSTSPASRNPIFIIVGVITALVLVVVIAAVAGVFVYLKSAMQTV